jgi:hypothetical protein
VGGGGPYTGGAAYVFVSHDGIWRQEAVLTVPYASLDDQIGQEGQVDEVAELIGLSGSTAIIGDPYASNDRGLAYVFSDGDGKWRQVGVLTAPHGEPGDGFGSSVAVSGSTALVGAPDMVRVGLPTRSGNAYIFTGANGKWKEQVELSAPDTKQADGFGSSVAVSGTTALVGAQFLTVGPNVDAGAGYIFASGSDSS